MLINCSIVLRPKDPYQDRPLPYIIGSEKWKASSKIGLESSSSESEHIEEEDEEFSSDTDSKVTDNILNTSNRQKTLRTRLSSTSSESNDYNLDSNSMRDINNGSFRAKSQDTLNLESEPMTPTSVLPKVISAFNTKKYIFRFLIILKYLNTIDLYRIRIQVMDHLVLLRN